MNKYFLKYFNGATEHFFTTSDGVKLHYWKKGKGNPLIIIPGWSGDAGHYCFTISPLSENNMVYILESRGHGESELPKHGYRLSRLAKDANEFLNNLSYEKACWLGHSMGCSVLWSYIDLFGQDSIEKLILVDQPPFLLANPQDTEQQIRAYGGQRIDLWQLVNAFERNWGEGWAAFTRYFRLELYQQNPELIELFQELAKRRKNNVFLAKLLLDHLTQDWRDIIPRINVPTLYISGDSSHATTMESSQWMVSVIKNCYWVRFSHEEYGTHNMMINSAQKFSLIVTAFLGENQDELRRYTE